jgi:uncharacterized membrane protein
MQVIDVGVTAGTSWLRQAFRMLAAQAIPWVSLISCWMMLCTALVILVPGIGVVAAVTMQPGFFAGFVLAARDQDQGLPVRLAHLFAGFRANGRQLMKVGGVMLFAYIVAIGILYLAGLPTLDELPARGSVTQAELFQAFMALVEARPWLLVVATLLSEAIRCLLWFTAPLLALNDMRAGHALRWGFYALISNLGPMLLFALLNWAMFYVAAQAWLIGLLVATPAFAIAHYTSYRAVFREAQDDPAT